MNFFKYVEHKRTERQRRKSSLYIEHWKNGFREIVREICGILSQYLHKWILRKWKFRFNSSVTTTLAPRQRDGEYKYSRGPTFGDFVTIRTEGSMQDVLVARLQVQEYRLSSPSSFKGNVLRESLSVDSQNIPCATLKRRRRR
jgi:hypothetical protein